ncbi:MAG: hypothetical protein MUF25_21710, partial [Pirellulaceae bacterium]|nr:hypothetical protein [Pirellulaceae bacterium]
MAAWKSDVATSIEFQNLRPQPIKVYRLDTEGKRVFLCVLPTGARRIEPTFLTHPWLLTDQHDNALGVYYPDSEKRLVTVVADRTLAQDYGSNAIRSVITIMGVDGKSKRVVLAVNRRFGAPSWSPDGSYLILNSGGMLWRLMVTGDKEPELVPTGLTQPVDINHGISPDGKTLAITTGPISIEAIGGGVTLRVTPLSPSYFHGWSPDGKTIVYTANRGRGYEIFATDIAGGAERPLAPDRKSSDSPSYSPDGDWVYFHSRDSGTSDLWRISSKGEARQAEKVFGDERENCTPRPSPDGKWLVFLSYPAGTIGNALDREVLIRRIPLPGAKVEPGQV